MSKFILTVFSEGGCGIEVSIGPCLKVSVMFSSPWVHTEEAARQANGGQQRIVAIPALSGGSGTNPLSVLLLKGKRDHK